MEVFRRALSGLGRTLIFAGVLILLFVAYQLWGTGLAEARSQRGLKKDFQRQVSAPSPECGDGTFISNPEPPATPEGEAVAILKICRIGVEKAIVEGVGTEDLKKGPGHYPKTPLPGQPGNAAIAGHRTTYGAPFYSIDEMELGDPILVTTAQGRFRYEVSEKKITGPSAVEVLDPTPDNRLTITTCEPRFSAAKRLIIVAKLVGEATPPPPRQEPVRVASLDAGLSGDRAARGPAVLWGAIAATVLLVTYLMSRLVFWRKWIVYAVGTPVFLVVLFVFFENFARLLPANV